MNLVINSRALEKLKEHEVLKVKINGPFHESTTQTISGNLNNFSQDTWEIEINWKKLVDNLGDEKNIYKYAVNTVNTESLNLETLPRPCLSILNNMLKKSYSSLENEAFGYRTDAENIQESTLNNYDSFYLAYVFQRYAIVHENGKLIDNNPKPETGSKSWG